MSCCSKSKDGSAKGSLHAPGDGVSVAERRLAHALGDTLSVVGRLLSQRGVTAGGVERSAYCNRFSCCMQAEAWTVCAMTSCM